MPRAVRGLEPRWSDFYPSSDVLRISVTAFHTYRRQIFRLSFSAVKELQPNEIALYGAPE